MTKPKATIRDVAYEAGVSVATVSRYLNGSEKILPETKQKVLDAMKALDFTPSLSARNLATNRTGSIGLLLNTITGDFFTPLLGGIEHWASRAGYSLLTSSTSQWSPDAGDLPPLGPRNCDGLIVVAGTLPDDLLAKWAAEGFPLVVVYGESPRGSGIPSVVLESRRSLAGLVSHLHHSHDRERFVFVAGPEETYDAREREAGFREALEALGMNQEEAGFVAGGFDREVAREAIATLIGRGRKFDAVVAADDESAYGALTALREAGIRVPDDVSVTGFDDQGFASMIQPALTTVVSPSEALGQTAVDLLLARLRGEAPAAITVVPTLEVYRHSCGCHPLSKR